MAANYLHGVETIVLKDGPRNVKLVKTAVTILVGTAVSGPVNEPILVLSDVQAAQFGNHYSGFTIASALDANFDQGLPNAGVVIVVNVLDPAVHKTAVTNEDHTFGDDDRITLAHPGVAALVLKNTGGTQTYVAGTDYTLDAATGVVTRKAGGAITAKQAVRATSYDYADPTKVLAADIIGTLNVSTGRRSGLQAALDCYNLFGFFPKRIIAPVYCTTNGVAVEMIAMANKIRGRAYIDAPAGLTPAQVIAGRGPAGTINFNTSSPRARLFYPHLKVLAPDGSTRLEPMSQRAAGLGNAVDIAYGYWYSMSNKEIAGVVGVERNISAMINDPNSEANLLNEAGITTVFNSFGTGLRLWGNRTAAWPTDTSVFNFENVQAVEDIIDESIEYFCLQFIDLPITNSWIDSVKESVNGFLRKLIGDGALLDGRCWYDKADNDPTELAAGHIVFSRDIMPPLPAERITHKTRININYLKSLGVS